MANFKVEFKGDSRGIHDWAFSCSGGNDSIDLNFDRTHSLSVVNTVFDALAKTYKVNTKETQENSK